MNKNFYSFIWGICGLACLLFIIFVIRLEEPAQVFRVVLFNGAFLGFILFYLKNLAKDELERRFFYQVYFTALSLRLLMALIFYLVQPPYPDPGYFESEISTWWHSQAADLASGRVPFITTRIGYTAYSAAVYKITAPNPNFAIITQSLWASIVPVYIYLTGKRLGLNNAGRIGGWLEAFYPFSIYYCATQQKEVFCLFLTTFLIWHGLRLIDGIRFWSLIQFISGTILLIFTRANLIALVILTSLVYLVFRRKMVIFTLVKFMVILCICLIILYHIPFIPLDLRKEIVVSIPTRAFTLYYRPNIDTSGADFISPIQRLKDPQTFSLSSLTGGAMALVLHPPLWDESTWKFILPNLGTFFHYALWPAIFYGLWLCWKEKGSGRLVFFFYGAGIFLLFLILGTTGASARHRLQLMPMFMILAGIGFQYFNRLRNIYWIYAGLAILLTWLIWWEKMGFSPAILLLVIIVAIILIFRGRHGIQLSQSAKP